MASRAGHRQHTSVASPSGAMRAGGAKRPKGAYKQVVTPPPKILNSKSKKKMPIHPEMIVERKIIDEILLIFSAAGSTETNPDGTEKFLPAEDCLKWMQDLQRVLRRDNDIYRPISLQLGVYNVVADKLLPLIMSCRYDKATVLTVCKILVLLTKPMTENAKKAGRMTLDVKSGKVNENVIDAQIELRENAIKNSDLLMEYKRVIVRHSSHNYAFQGTSTSKQGKCKKKGTGLLSVFTSLLADPLDQTGSARNSNDHLVIELVLHFFRNLLSISPLNNFGSTKKAQEAAKLHRELLIVFQEEDVLDVLVVVGQDVERRENAGYNLLLMEIMSHLLKGQDPSDVALSAIKKPMSISTLSSPVPLSGKKKSASKKIIRTTTTTSRAPMGGDSLKAVLQSERNKLQLSASSRHGHFGGTLMINKPGGKQSYVSASGYLAKKSQGQSSGTNGSMAGIAAPTRRKNKKAEVFVGSGKSSTLHSRPGASAALSREVAGPITKRAKGALHAFCTRFVMDCYGPVMKSLKNEFRRDSNRLEDGDRTMFFRIVWFFHQWWRVGKEQENERKPNNKGKTSGSDRTEALRAKNLIFTMDVFMFNLVLNSTDEFHEHKKPAALAQTVALYTEMVHVLHAMYDSADSTERMMALGLMDRIYYGNEPLDRLPKLLARWVPGMFGREYLCDLVECAHVTWKLLDANAERCLKSVSDNELDQKRPKDAIQRMDLTAAEFEKDHCFMRKFVSNQIVFMYIKLLSQYGVNAAPINRHITAYFIRLCKFTVKNMGEGADIEFDDALGKNELAVRQTTFEPLLYNINLLNVLEKVLNDTAIRENPDFEALLIFAASFMKRFARAAEENPMLFVEAMFKHPIPHRFCELSTNLYVNEELRMIAVRDLLLEDQRRYEAQDDEEGANENKEIEDAEHGERTAASGYADNEEEEELEFNDDEEDGNASGIVKEKKRRKRKSKKNRKSMSKSATMEEELSDAEEEEADFNENEGEDANAKDDEGEGSEQQGKDISTDEADLSNGRLDTQDDTDSPKESVSEDASASPKLSGKKRIRKALEGAGNDEDSDDEDFLGGPSATNAPMAKVSKRVIFDDDDDDD